MRTCSTRKKAIRRLKGEVNENLVLLFADSAEVSLMPTITRCWTKVGAQRVILTPGVRAKKRWNWGAVDVVTGRTVHLLHRRRNNVGFRRLLAAIARTYQLAAHPNRKLILFVDNDRAHSAKQVNRLLNKYEGRIVIEWLPPYSPELNPQEDIWQHMRRRVTHNHYFETIQALTDAVEEFHQQLDESPECVLKLISKWTKLIAT